MIAQVLATVNLYNLQGPGKAMNLNQTPWTPEEFSLKAQWTVWQLGVLMKPDIVGLQELWSKKALDAVLNYNYGTKDEPKFFKDEYDALAKPASGAKIICGALVRKGLLTGEPKWQDKFPKEVKLDLKDDPNDRSRRRSRSPSTPSRPVLRFQVKLRDDQTPTEVFVTHLKSKLPTDVSEAPWFVAKPEMFKPHQKTLGAGISTIRRTAEAVALRVMLTGVMKGTTTPVIVLGDINDGQSSNTANILTEQPNYLVGAATGGADVGLYTAQTLQEYRDTRDVYYTHVHQDLRESLDHVLVSEQFYDNSRKRLWLFDGLVINNDHLNFENHKETGTGDHGVVKVTFKFKPA